MILTPQQPTLARHASNAAESAHTELWRGLVGAWVPALGYQGSKLKNLALRTNFMSDQGSSAWIKTRFGDSLDLARRDGNFYADLSYSLPSSATITIMVSLVTDGGGGSTGDYPMWIGSGDNIGLGFKTDSSDIRLFPNDVSGILDPGVSIGAKEKHVVVGVLRQSSENLWVNGNDVANGSTGRKTSETKIALGGNVGISRGFGAHYITGCLWHRELSASEIRTLSRDPLAPFRVRDDTALVTAAMFGGATTPSVTLPPPLFNMQMTGSF